MFSSLKLKFRRSKISNFLLSIKRDIFSGNIKPTLNIKKYKLTKIKFIQAFSILFLLILFLFHLNLYFSLTPNRYTLTEEVYPKDLSTKNLNVIFLLYNEVETDGLIYKYVNSATLVSITQNKKAIFQFDPDILLTNGRALKFALNSFEDSSNSIAVDLVRNVEDTYGLRIDRYIFIDSNKFIKLFDVKDSDFIKTLSKEKLEQGDFNVQVSYFKQFIQDRFNIINKYKYFFDSSAISSSIYTNLNRSELITFVELLSKKTRVVAEFSKGEFISEELPQGSISNQIILDDFLRSYLQSVEVVSEQAQIEVYNSTDIQGLATVKSRQLSNSGIYILAKGNYFETVEENLLFIDSEEDRIKYKNTIEVIKLSLNNNIRIIINDYKYNKIADLILVLGDGRTF